MKLRASHLWASRRSLGCAAALGVAFSLIAFTAGFAQQQSLPMATGERPLAARIKTFEAADRDKWQKPDEIVKVLDLKPGMTVADIGAGSGYFTRRFAKAVGPSGKVYAVDISRDILVYLKNRAQKEDLHNIEIVVDKPDDPMLPANSLDLAFFGEVTHHIGHRSDFFRKIYTALKPNGRMAIVDFPPEAHAKGWCPHPADQLIPSWEIIREAEDAGFKLDRTYDFIPREYFIVFDKGAPTWHELARAADDLPAAGYLGLIAQR
ncbi:MAG TPA: methyltransferase domain-containing protein [Candidatus Binataceae bacterium]|nr:methyltransferase domain-containing protein [Candidatus Binataceae bacterium]